VFHSFRLWHKNRKTQNHETTDCTYYSMCFAVENNPMELYIPSLFHPQHSCQDQYGSQLCSTVNLLYASPTYILYPIILFNLTIPTLLSLVGGPLLGNGCGVVHRMAVVWFTESHIIFVISFYLLLYLLNLFLIN
jgi:hypothetical protein